MLTVLTIAVVFIAIVLSVVHWQIVQKAILWAAAAASIFALLASVIAFIVAIVNLEIVPALVGFALLVVFGLLSAVEEWDRNSQFAKFRAYLRKRDS